MSQPGLGDVAFLGIGEETTWGDAVSRTKFVRLISESLKLNAGFNFPDVGTHGHAQRAAVKLPVYVDGDVEVEMNFYGFGLLLKHLLGGTAISTDTKTFTPETALPVGLSLEIDRDKGAFVYKGCKINSASFSQARGELLKATVSVIGKGEDTSTATADTFPTDRPILDDYFAMELNDTAVLIQEWTMDIANSLSGGDRSDLGVLTIKEPVRTAKQVISGTFTAEFDDETVLDKWRARDDVKLELLYTGGKFDTDTAKTFSLNFVMPTVKITAGAAPVSGIGPIIQSFAFQARYNTTGTAEAISIALCSPDTITT